MSHFLRGEGGWGGERDCNCKAIEGDQEAAVSVVPNRLCSAVRMICHPVGGMVDRRVRNFSHEF